MIVTEAEATEQTQSKSEPHPPPPKTYAALCTAWFPVRVLTYPSYALVSAENSVAFQLSIPQSPSVYNVLGQAQTKSRDWGKGIRKIVYTVWKNSSVVAYILAMSLFNFKR